MLPAPAAEAVQTKTAEVGKPLTRELGAASSAPSTPRPSGRGAPLPLPLPRPTRRCAVPGEPGRAAPPAAGPGAPHLPEPEGQGAAGGAATPGQAAPAPARPGPPPGLASVPSLTDRKSVV